MNMNKIMTKNEQRATLRSMITYWDRIRLVNGSNIEISRDNISILVNMRYTASGDAFLNYWMTAERVTECGVTIKYPCVASCSKKLIEGVGTLLNDAIGHYKQTGRLSMYPACDSWDEEIPF